MNNQGYMMNSGQMVMNPQNQYLNPNMMPPMMPPMMPNQMMMNPQMNSPMMMNNPNGNFGNSPYEVNPMLNVPAQTIQQVYAEKRI